MGGSSERSFIMMALEGAEACIDFLTESEAVKAVPVLSSAVHLLEGVDDLRSKLFAAKLATFISEPSLARSLKAVRLRAEILKDDEHATEIGGTLLMVIDKMTDLKKPPLLAKVYAYLLEGGIGRAEFLLLAHAIDVGAVGDLEQLIQGRQPHVESEGTWQARLTPTGLLVTDIVPLFGGTRVTYYISPLGETFLQALDRANQTF